MVDSIKLTSPSGGEIWTPGSVHNIMWTRIGGTLGPNIKIELWKDGVFKQQLVYAQPGTSFSWTIPSNLVIGSNYKIFIMGCSLDPTTNKCVGYPSNMSNAFFIGTAPVGTVKLTSPGIGTIWKKGSQYNITWITTGDIKPGVKLELYKGEIFDRQIVFETPIVGGNSYSWTIPNDLVSGTDYKIRIMTCILLEGRCIAYPSGYSNTFTINDIVSLCNGPICNLIIS